jgi:hypothetical protein
MADRPARLPHGRNFEKRGAVIGEIDVKRHQEAMLRRPRLRSEANMNRFLPALAIFLAGATVPYLFLGEPRPAWAVLPPTTFSIKEEPKPLTKSETKRVEAYLRRRLDNPNIRLALQSTDADVLLGEQFIGVVYAEEEGGERTFYFEMAIFGSDLDRDSPTESKR